MSNSGWPRKHGALLAVSLMLIGLLVIPDQSSGGVEYRGEPSYSRVKRTFEGRLLGGGEFVGVVSGDGTSMLGLLYGTEDNPNHVYLVSVYTRYLGRADVYDSSGDLVKKGRPIPVRTIYAQRFDTIYEFFDQDHDGMFDPSRESATRQNDTSDEEASSEVATREPVYKKAVLKTSWRLSELSSERSGDTLRWSLKLTSRPIPYVAPLLESRLDRYNVVDRVELTFSFNLSIGEVEKEVPNYEVHLGSAENGYSMTSTLLGNRTVKGKEFDLSVKYDQLIEGWDFFRLNRDPGLLMSTELIFATGVNEHDWLKKDVVDGMEEKEVRYRTDKEERRLREEDSLSYEGSKGVLYEGVGTPKAAEENGLSVFDQWANIGRLRWVSDVEVDGERERMYFQVYYSRRIPMMDIGGAQLKGMGVMGGFSYPGGKRIFHDPTFETSMFLIEEKNDEDIRVRPLLIIASVAVFIVIVTAVVTSLIALDKRAKDDLDRLDEDEEEEYYGSYYLIKPKG